MTEDYYRKFQIIIAGLDNIDARRWLNALVHNLVKFDKNSKPLPET